MLLSAMLDFTTSLPTAVRARPSEAAGIMCTNTMNIHVGGVNIGSDAAVRPPTSKPSN